MTGLRLEAEARLEDATEGLIGGGHARLVTLKLFDGTDYDGPQAAVRALLRPGEARQLAFALLGLAAHAEQLTEAGR